MRATADKTLPETWPALPHAEWSNTCSTLPLWMQVVGKIRMALTPPINHTWNVTLYPTVRGLTTSPMFLGNRILQIDFDFLDHMLQIDTDAGEERTIPLEPMSVAVFLPAGDGCAGKHRGAGPYMAQAVRDLPSHSVREG